MASLPTDPPNSNQTNEPAVHVFRAHANLLGLDSIATATWQQITDHIVPLQPSNAAVKLLLITGRGSTCEAIEALQLQTDGFGFLLTWDASPTQSLPSLHHAEFAGKVVDSRQRFLRRYLSHRHSWQPSTPLLAEALIRSGYGDSLEHP